MLPHSPLFFETFFLLLFGHFLADFPLQGDYIARMKIPHLNPKENWIIVMFAHCIIHAGIVFIFTGSLLLAMIMLLSHFIIDVAKCEQYLGKSSRAFLYDQLLHILILILIAGLYCMN